MVTMPNWQPGESLRRGRRTEGELRPGDRVWWTEPDAADLGGRVVPGRRLNGVVRHRRGAFTIIHCGVLGDLTVPTSQLARTDDMVLYD
jgi:hypothetical protein